ncbi:carbohydrate kinase domain-containing protein [Trichoderma breve]|uniref:ATP-dependent (S)-NAD(P)H-hydrate dehydratase n=1 Tax=Trichoderma breve TaxID=2034170 RepID=A0A9W9B8A0_9HYPO|nr:carbohydrate kinase domain-containing protein [Trichoderma breve]KAJ4855268.1 carbohydrate kinase domain-containing protein [Trichoderma breve]
MSVYRDVPEMSASTKNILGKVRRMVPPMLDTFHKGQLGRVAVIGGSEDYTGAPYFSAMASARLGCDMSHVICTPAAAAVIKTYSPNLMVHPLMRQSPPQNKTSEDEDSNPDHVARKIIDMLGRLHVLVVGPGLGRDPLMQATVARVIRAARESNMPVVLDADALQVVQNDPDVVRGYKYAVLTPNVVEFKRLCDALKIDVGQQSSETGKVETLAKELGGVTIIQKGYKDFISNGKVTLVSDLEGGKKRSGGQGDTLTGAVATFLGWRKAYLDGLWKDHEQPALDADEMMGLAAFGGSAVTRECSRLAFVKKGRSLQASDLTDEVHTAFMGLFGEDDGEADAAKL